MRAPSTGPAPAILAVALASLFSYSSGTPRMPGRRPNRKSAACTNNGCDGRLTKRADGLYHCSKCLLTLKRMPRRKR